MKTPTNNLYKLINSMTAAEKRYFKLHYSSEKNLTTDLFDFINTMQEYEEEQIKKHFASTKVAKNLKVYKVQLTKLLLKSLASHHNKKTIGSKIRMGLEEVEILMNKQLYELAKTNVIKIKKLCLKHEEFFYIFPILSYEIQLENFSSISSNKRNELYSEIKTHTKSISNIHRLQHTNYLLADMMNNQMTNKLSTVETEFCKDFLKQEEASLESKNLSFQEKQWINSSISVIYHILHDDSEKEFYYKKKNISLFEKHPRFIINHPHFYYAALFNFLSLSIRLEKFEELEIGIPQITKIVNQFPFLKKNFIFIKYLEVKYYYKSKKFEEIDELFESNLLKQIRKFKNEDGFLTTIIFNYMALFYLAQENYKRVHFYLRRLHFSSKNLDKNYVLFFEALELITYYLSDSINPLQKALASHARKSSKGDVFSSFCQFLKELVAANPNERKALAKKYKSATKNLEENSLLNLLNEFILQDWLNAIIQGHSYINEIINK